MSLTTKVLLALVAAVALGVIISRLGSEPLMQVATGIEPVGTIWVNAIRMTVIPLVAASLVAAFAKAPDARTAGRVGGISLAVFLVMLGVTAVITVLVTPPLVGLIGISNWTGMTPTERALGLGMASNAVLPTFQKWVVDLIPVNPIKAATDGAILPLIVFCMALGAAATRTLPASRDTLVNFFTSIADTMLKVMHWVLAFAPMGVFALALPLSARLGAGIAGAAVLYVALVSLLCIVMGLLLYPVAALFGGVPILRFARGCLPAQTVAATSRSSLAALPAMLTGAEEQLGLEPAVTRFYLPLAVSMFRIGAVIAQVTGVLFIAHLLRVEVTGLALWGVALTAVLASFSVPGVAYGSILVMVPVLVYAKVPPEGIGILLALDTIPDIFRTTLNVTAHMTGATIVARHAGPVVSRASAT